MRKFLSIVIPRYKETEREIFPLLSSISGQVGVDYSSKLLKCRQQRIDRRY